VTAPTRSQAEHALASLIHAIRPGWGTPGILAEIRKRPGVPLDQLAAAALWATSRRDQHSPHLIGEDDGMAWLRGLRDEDTLLQFEMNRDLNDEVIGWVLPATQRRHYISRTAAKKWCERAHTLGAECHFIESEPVAWTSIDNGAAK